MTNTMHGVTCDSPVNNMSPCHRQLSTELRDLSGSFSGQKRAVVLRRWEWGLLNPGSHLLKLVVTKAQSTQSIFPHLLIPDQHGLNITNS